MERAFQANGNDGKFKGGRDNDCKRNAPRKNRGAFKGKCFGCDQVGHMKRDYQSQRGGNGNEAVFYVGEEHLKGWLIYSGATSHMTPPCSDLFDYGTMDTNVEVTIADGKKLKVHGRGTVRLSGLNNRRIKMMDVLFIPGLDRRLLSVGQLAERGLNVEFQRSSCVICGDGSAIAVGKRWGKRSFLTVSKRKHSLCGTREQVVSGSYGTPGWDTQTRTQ